MCSLGSPRWNWVEQNAGEDPGVRSRDEEERVPKGGWRWPESLSQGPAPDEELQVA